MEDLWQWGDERDVDQVDLVISRNWNNAESGAVGWSLSQTWDTDKMESRVVQTKYDAKTGETVVVRDDVYKLVPRENPVCPTCWGSHGCDLDKGHDGPHICDCGSQPRADTVCFDVESRAQ